MKEAKKAFQFEYNCAKIISVKLLYSIQLQELLKKERLKDETDT